MNSNVLNIANKHTDVLAVQTFMTLWKESLCVVSLSVLWLLAAALNSRQMLLLSTMVLQFNREMVVLRCFLLFLLIDRLKWTIVVWEGGVSSTKILSLLL